MVKYFLFFVLLLITRSAMAESMQNFGDAFTNGTDFTTYFSCNDVNDCLNKEQAKGRNLWFKKCMTESGGFVNFIAIAISDHGVLLINNKENYLIFGYLDGDIKSKRIFAYWNAPIDPEKTCYLPKHIQFLGIVPSN